MRRSRTAIVVSSIVLVLAGCFRAAACPFCSAPSLTLSEQLAQSVSAILAQWVEADAGDGESPAHTTLEVVEVHKAPEGSALAEGGQVTLPFHREGKPGDLFLLMVADKSTVEQSVPIEVTRTSYDYIVRAPNRKLPTAERLLYFLEYLEYPEPVVANDAYAEFANAPYADIASLASKFQVDKVRAWALGGEVPSNRLGLYGLMIGLCGTPEDAEALKAKIGEKSQDYRLGIDGLIAGYLLLRGEAGLELVDETKLKDKTAPFSETYAAMQALRFLWEYAPEIASQERLRQSMRLLLDRQEVVELVIRDLSRWRDWEAQDRLMNLYDAPGYDIPSVRLAIISFMLVSTKNAPPEATSSDGANSQVSLTEGSVSEKGAAVEEPEQLVAVVTAEASVTATLSNKTVASIEPKPVDPPHVAKGKACLTELRKRDPDLVREAERSIFLR